MRFVPATTAEQQKRDGLALDPPAADAPAGNAGLSATLNGAPAPGRGRPTALILLVASAEGVSQTASRMSAVAEAA
jgi:hypothetical protein